MAFATSGNVDLDVEQSFEPQCASALSPTDLKSRSNQFLSHEPAEEEEAQEEEEEQEVEAGEEEDEELKTEWRR